MRYTRTTLLCLLLVTLLYAPSTIQVRTEARFAPIEDKDKSLASSRWLSADWVLATTVGGAGKSRRQVIPSQTRGFARDPAGRTAPMTLPPQGLYESCLPTDASCLDRLTEMGTKGFTIVLNDGLRYAYTAESLRAYADHAQRLRMKVILPVKYSPQWDTDASSLVKEFSNLARECGCTNNEQFLKYYITALKDHPALWGYYIADEVHPEYHRGLRAYSDLVKRIDPSHPRLIVEEGSNDAMEIFFTFHSYMNDAVDVLAADYYPYGYIDTFSSLTRHTGASAGMTQYWSDKLKLKSAMVLQTFAWPQFYDATNPLCQPWPSCAPFPSLEQMKAQRDQTLLNARPEIILWFDYPRILASDNPKANWSNLVAAAFSPLPAGAVSPAPVVSRLSGCPEGWNCEDIGRPSAEGGQTFDGSTWVVEGSGWDIWSIKWVKADQFRYVWREVPAATEVSARAIAQTGPNPASKAGIMVRATFDPTAPYYAVMVTGGGEIRVQYRLDFNENPQRLTYPAVALPVFLMISKSGGAIGAFISKDGSEWSSLPNSAVTMARLQGNAMAGLAVTSRNENELNRAQFDSVSVRPR